MFLVLRNVKLLRKVAHGIILLYTIARRELHAVCVGMGGAKGMAGMAIPIPLLGALWSRMAFALCCLVFRLQWQQNLINNN